VNAPATPAPSGKYCAACGTLVVASAVFCTRCGAPQPGWAPPPGVRSSGAGTTIAVVLGVGAVVVLAIVGILAAIAIPNFIRYQQRSKAVGIEAELLALSKAEVALRDHTGEFLGFRSLPAGRSPGREAQPWSPEDVELAANVGWTPATPSLAVYAAEVGHDAQGNPSLSLCATTDLDGDGRRAAWAIFLPAEDEFGAITDDPPPAPCHGAVMSRAARSLASDPPGKPIRLSPDDVF
jgi:type IV pilus assembly protein PilA